MKIVLSNDSQTAHFYIRLGFARAFTAAGHEVTIWDCRTKSIHEVLDDIQSDLLWIQNYNMTPAYVRAITEYISKKPEVKIIARTADWGILSDDMDLKKYPILVATEKDRRLLGELRDNTGKPDFIFNHYLQEDLEQTHSHWIEEGYKVVSLLNAADLFDYTGGKFKEEYAGDVAFVGGSWSFKNKTLSKYLLPLCNGKFKVKIFGNQGSIGGPYHCGFAEQDQVKHILASAKVCLNLSEPHSQDFGYDIIERPFKLLSNKCFCISDRIRGLETLFSNEIVFADDPKDFYNQIRHYVNDEKGRQVHIERGYKAVLRDHTYFDRCATIFQELALPREEQKIWDAKAKMLESLE